MGERDLDVWGFQRRRIVCTAIGMGSMVSEFYIMAQTLEIAACIRGSVDNSTLQIISFLLKSL